MSDIPHPIVRCTDPAARRKLAQDLMDLGFDRGYNAGMMSDSRPYICLIPSRSISLAEEGEMRDLSNKSYWGAPMTLVNSPAQMIAYAKRAKLASIR